jgi:hypothetical protein
MASLNQMIDAAEAAGFVRAECVHGPQHVVLDYPEALTDKGRSGPFWRIHTDLDKHVTLISGTDTPDQRVSLKNAIDFAERVARQNPKENRS